MANPRKRRLRKRLQEERLQINDSIPVELLVDQDLEQQEEFEIDCDDIEQEEILDNNEEKYNLSVRKEKNILKDFPPIHTYPTKKNKKR